MKIYLIRHGHVPNRASDLDQEGISQAKEAAAFLQGLGLPKDKTILVSSRELRTLQTTHIIREQLGLSTEILNTQQKWSENILTRSDFDGFLNFLISQELVGKEYIIVISHEPEIDRIVLETIPDINKRLYISHASIHFLDTETKTCERIFKPQNPTY